VHRVGADIVHDHDRRVDRFGPVARRADRRGSRPGLRHASAGRSVHVPDKRQRRRGASTSTGDSPDITIRFDVDGRILQHELDLSRIERPPGIRVFLNAATVENRFDLTTPFDPSAWISCAAEQCEIVATQQDPTSRPVLPHEDATDLVAP
jgi:hypothetical protein